MSVFFSYGCVADCVASAVCVFYACLSLTNITIPDSVTSMGEYVFGVDYALTDVYLEWDTSTEIVQYDSTWIFDTNSGLKFHIPSGTTSLYTAKGYPSDKLVEESPAPSVDSLTLAKSAGKQVLSYADKTSGSGNTEFCTLTATALDSNSQGVSGQSVVFKNGDTTLDTVTTDSNGEASYTYVSQGVGDVTITAECRLLIQTYTVYDYYYYDSLTTDKQRYTTITGTPSISYNSDGLYLTTSVASVCLIRNNFLTLPSDYQAEITVTNVGSSSYGVGLCFDDYLVDREPSQMRSYKLSSTTNLQTIASRWQTNDVVKFVKQGTTMTVYINGTQITSSTVSDDNHYQQFRTYKDRPSRFKDLKIKSL